MTTVHELVTGFILGPVGDGQDDRGLTQVWALATDDGITRAQRLADGMASARALYAERGRDFDAEGGPEQIVWSDQDSPTVTLPNGDELTLWEPGDGVIAVPDESLPDSLRTILYGPPQHLVDALDEQHTTNETENPS
jgi:hypothetical protein